MTKMFTKTLGLTAFVGVLSTMSLLSNPASASMQSELHRCTSSSFGKTVNCCEAVLDKAVWQVGISAKNCEKNIACVKLGNGKRRCVVKIHYSRPQWTYDRDDRNRFKGPVEVKVHSRGNGSFN